MWLLRSTRKSETISYVVGFLFHYYIKSHFLKINLIKVNDKLVFRFENYHKICNYNNEFTASLS